MSKNNQTGRVIKNSITPPKAILEQKSYTPPTAMTQNQNTSNNSNQGKGSSSQNSQNNANKK